MVKTSTPDGGGERDLGDFPNAPNIREWMRQYFGTMGPKTDIRFTLWHERGELPVIDTPAAALYFGLSKGYRLTDAGRAKAYELGILSEDSPAIPIQPKGIFQKPSSGAAIGANGWADIRLVVRIGGVTFHGPGGLRPLTWEKMGLGEEKAPAQTAFLILLAKAGGHLPHSERVESKPDTGGNRTTWTAKDWEREAERATIRKFSERAAGENEQTKLRANVRRLNEKFMALFPSIQGRPFENRKGATISNFKRIEFK